MAILNSSFSPEELRVINVVINSITAILINIQSRMRISEVAASCKDLAIRFNKLQSEIDKAVSFNDLSNDKISGYIKEYEILIAACPVFPAHIKDNLKKQLNNTIETPFILNGYIEKKANVSSTTIHLSSAIITDGEDRNIVGLNL
eukprot:227707-Hanusia_phi.AAC.1